MLSTLRWQLPSALEDIGGGRGRLTARAGGADENNRSCTGAGAEIANEPNYEAALAR
jgi:hypothetical protein